MVVPENEPTAASQNDPVESRPLPGNTHDRQRGWPLESLTCARDPGTDPGRQSRAEGLPHCVSSPPRSLPSIPVSPTRCRERFGVSPAAPYAAAPFESKWRLAFRAGLGPLSRVLPRRRTSSGKPGCLSPFRHPFGYGKIAPPVHSDSVSPSRRRTLP